MTKEAAEEERAREAARQARTTDAGIRLFEQIQKPGAAMTPKPDAPLLPNWTEPVSCPSCHKGYIVARESKFGRFYGCTEFPRCRRKFTHAELGSLLDPDYDEPRYGE